MTPTDERLNKILQRIAELRKLKHLTVEQMAESLNISAPAYHKIERGATKLTVDRLLQISHILDTSVYDLLDLKGENIYHQVLNDNAVGHQEIKNMYNENKGITDKLVESLKSEIEFLRAIVKSDIKAEKK